MFRAKRKLRQHTIGIYRHNRATPWLYLWFRITTAMINCSAEALLVMCHSWECLQLRNTRLELHPEFWHLCLFLPTCLLPIPLFCSLEQLLSETYAHFGSFFLSFFPFPIVSPWFARFGSISLACLQKSRWAAEVCMWFAGHCPTHLLQLALCNAHTRFASMHVGNPHVVIVKNLCLNLSHVRFDFRRQGLARETPAGRLILR